MLGGSIHERFCTSESLRKNKSYGQHIVVTCPKCKQSQTLNRQKLLKTIPHWNGELNCSVYQ